jgi:hypothetical protein
MVNMRELWEPIVLSSAGVFVASATIWMALGYHKDDAVGVKNEEALRKALKEQDLAPNQYVIPYCPDQKERVKPEFQQKMKDGPLAMLTIRAAGIPDMKRTLGAWFFNLLILNSVIAYIAGRVGSHDIPFLAVFRAVATIALLAYAGALPVASIFWARPWRVTLKDMFDACIYAVIVGAVFGWLWPK